MIWRRYILLELVKVFCLFMGAIYFLYILIDYAAHTKTFHQEGIGLLDIFLYYLFQLTKRADILVPIALMISTIKVLTTLNMRNEIVALVTAGLPLKKIMRPPLYFSALCAALLYLNFQFLQPLSLTSLSNFEESYFKERSGEHPIEALPLSDNSLLLYQRFDRESRVFFDAYWYKSADLIYRIQTLYPDATPPFGEYVDILKREEGRLKRVSSYDSLSLPDLRFDAHSLFTASHPTHSQSITQLFSNLRWKTNLTDREAEAATIFYYKLLIPLASLFAVFLPAPFCLRFSRHLPIFFLFTLSLFGIITFFTFVNSCVILGKSQVIPPLWALLIPFGPLFALFWWRYAKF